MINVSHELPADRTLPHCIMDHGLPVLSSNVVAFHFKGGKPQAGQGPIVHWIYAGWYRKGYMSACSTILFIKTPKQEQYHI